MIKYWRMPTVPVEKRYTHWKLWAWAKEDIHNAIVAQHDDDAAFIATYEFIMPIAAELVRLQHPGLDGPDFDRLVNKLGWAMFIIEKPQYDH